MRWSTEMSNTYSQILPHHIIRQEVTEVFEDVGAECKIVVEGLREDAF